jgi:hypothetical protein
MRRRVKVTLPKGKKGLEARTSGLEVRMSPGLGFNANQLSWPVMAGEFSQPEVETNSTLKPVPREEANLEAEVGETAVTDLNGDGIPEHYKIGGKRHHAGGTPLYLPDNSFIFSRDRSMKIKDKEILRQFGMPERKGGYTPAEIAKKYDINKFRKILGDPNTDDLQRKTAESMISSYNLKLGKLALAQESIKGFPQGIPAIAIPYMESVGIQPEQLIQQAPSQMSQQEVDTEEIEDQPVVSEEEVEMPEARYGMNIMPQLLKRGFGGGLNKFIRGGSNKRRVRVSMPMFQQGGQLERKVYASDAEMYDDPQIAERIKQGQAYITGEDGKSRRVTELPPRFNLDERTDLAVLKGEGKRDYRDDYVYLENELYLNEGARTAIYNNYKTTIKNDKKIPASEKEQLLAKTPEEVIQDFLALQKHNMALAAKGVNFTNPEWKNKTGQPQKAYEKAVRNIGLEPLDKTTIRSGQAAYIGFVNAAKNDDTKQYFTNIKPQYQYAEGDEEYLTDINQVSPPDGIYGDTTAGQVALVDFGVKTDQELKEEGKKQDDLKYKHLETKPYTGTPEFWLQDVIKGAGATRDYLGLKKYMPWQAVPQTYLPEPTFFDPNRELAANMEAANIVTQGLGAFSGPQALSSRASQIQGQTAKAAADILGKYNNLNVGVANEFELQKTSILNQAAERNASLATNLYDKVTIANQQFDAAKTASRQNVLNNYVQAITNRANTYNLNTLYPQYAVDPTSGGIIDFTQGAPITPEAGNEPSVGDIYQNLYDTYPTMRQNPERLWATAEKMAGVKSGSDNKMADWFSKMQNYQGE